MTQLQLPMPSTGVDVLALMADIERETRAFVALLAASPPEAVTPRVRAATSRCHDLLLQLQARFTP